MNKTELLKRKIIKVDEGECDGCGICVMACAEGALQVIDGKAKLVSDKYCDGLGACLPECPQGAISFEEREAEAFDEEAAMEHTSERNKSAGDLACGCPGSSVRQFNKDEHSGGCPSAATQQFKGTATTAQPATGIGRQPSELGHWPVQLTLVPSGAPFLKGADVLLAADCTAFAYGGFHGDFLRDHALLIACPKLDNYDAHQEKLNQIVSRADIKSLTVLRMEAPCCSGLTRMAMQAILSSKRDIPFKEIIISTDGRIKGT